MVENIKITASNINNAQNNLNRPKAPEKPELLSPFDMLDPNSVNKAIKEEGAGFNNQNNIAYNPNSVFEKFLKTLDIAPSLVDGMKKLLLNKQFFNENIKSNPVLKAFFEEFIKDIETDEEKLLEFIKFQHNSYTKFSGAFFNFLRDSLATNPDDNFKKLAGNFMKAYDAYLSIDDTTNAIANTLDHIKDNIPSILKDTFAALVDKFITNNPDNSVDINLALLKNDIIPFLGKYVAKTNDFGEIRDYISALIHNIVRLEAGEQSSFTNSTESLFNYIKYNFNLTDSELSDLRHSLITNFRNYSDLKNNALELMFKMIDTGIKDVSNYTTQTTFESVEESLLINNHVQIPLIHIFLPVNYNGIFMLSEMWISKELEEDAESVKNNKKSKNKNSTEVHKIFLTFDIENLGYFETVFLSKNENISLDIFVPSVLANISDVIKKDISSIITKNNLNVSNVFVSECKKRRRFNEVFNTKFIKESGINVIA